MKTELETYLQLKYNINTSEFEWIYNLPIPVLNRTFQDIVRSRSILPPDPLYIRNIFAISLKSDSDPESLTRMVDLIRKNALEYEQSLSA